MGLLLTGLLLAGALAGCGGASCRDTTLQDGTDARLYRQQDGTASITTLSQQEMEGYRLITKTSVTGEDTAEGIEYTTWYYIQVYQPLSDSEEDQRLAAEAFDSAKPDPAWKSDDPVHSRKTGSARQEGYSLSYNDETRTFAYTIEESGTLEYHLTEQGFDFEPLEWKEAAGA